MPITYDIVYEFSDNDGDSASCSTHVPNSFTLSQYTEFARALAALKDAVTVGLLRACSLVIGVNVSALISNGVGVDSDVEEIAAFQFRSAQGFPVKVNVPGVLEMLVASGSDELDQADPDIAAFLTAMQSGIAVTGGTIIPCDVGESDIVSLDYARENFRASGKRV